MPDFTIHAAWKLGNAQFESDAIRLWTSRDVMPPDQTAEERTKQLTAVAYTDDQLIGVTTATIGRIPSLRANLAMIRIFIAPDFRGHGLLALLVEKAFGALESWAISHPNADVAGLGSIRENVSDDPGLSRPFNKASGTTLVGYTDAGQQLRVRWFPHYRPPAEARHRPAQETGRV